MRNDQHRARRRRRLAALAALLTAGAVAGGAAYASIPDNGGVIHACYAPKNGSVRVIDTALNQRCSSNERSLNWNQSGPQGPTGPAGPSEVFIMRQTTPVTATASGGTAVLPGPLQLPPGNYVLSATVSASSSGDDSTLLTCSLVDEPLSKERITTIYDERSTTLLDEVVGVDLPGETTLPLHATLNGGGPVYIVCSVRGLRASALVSSGILTATKVETIVEQ